MRPVKNKKLIEMLQKLDPESYIVLSSDSEGNSYNYFGGLFSDETTRFNPERREFIEKEDSPELFKKAKKVIVLYP